MGTKERLFFGILSLLFIISYLVLFVFNPEMINSLTAEDHLYENAQAVCFLVTSIVFFILFLKDKSGNEFHVIQTRKNIFFLIFALLFFFGFGEEISWGQRIFYWRPPGWLTTMNVQGEANIHNLNWFNWIDAQGNLKSFWARMLDFNRIYSIFYFTYCFLIPILDKINIRFHRWIRRLNLPIVPIWMGVLLPLNYLIYKIIELYFTNSHWRTQSEIKESVSSILFVGISIWFLRNPNKMRADLRLLPNHSSRSNQAISPSADRN